jgi:hypothetical protein
MRGIPNKIANALSRRLNVKISGLALGSVYAEAKSESSKFRRLYSHNSTDGPQHIDHHIGADKYFAFVEENGGVKRKTIYSGASALKGVRLHAIIA